MFEPIKVVDVELSRPLNSISNLDGYGEIEALVRLHGRPIAKVQIPVTDGGCSAKTLLQAVLEQHHGAIARSLVQNELAAILEQNQSSISDLLQPSEQVDDENLPLVTIAVCTRDRVTDLKLCLDAMNCLDYPNLDILVIDNAPSTDATESLLSTTYPHIRYVREPRPGLSWARNRAIVEARGEIIAYTDDDVSVDPGWIRALVQVFTSSEVMAVTGYVAAYELETKAQIVFEQSYRFGRGFERKWIQVEQKGRKTSVAEYGATAILGTGANMAYRRDLFDRIGYFDPALGSGTVTAGGEDLEMFFRVLKEGYVLVYEPNALVRHRHRHDYAQLQKQITNNNVGYCSYLVRSILAYPDTYFDFVQIGLACILSSFNRLLRSFIRPSHYPRDLILSELQGFYLGFGRYQQACQIATQITDNFGAIVPEIRQKITV